MPAFATNEETPGRIAALGVLDKIIVNGQFGNAMKCKTFSANSSIGHPIIVGPGCLIRSTEWPHDSRATATQYAVPLQLPE